jgi:hypothetical protein
MKDNLPFVMNLTSVNKHRAMLNHLTEVFAGLFASSLASKIYGVMSLYGGLH